MSKNFRVATDNPYETAYARVQVAPATALHLVAVSGNQRIGSDGVVPLPVITRVTDINNLPYPGVRVQASPSGNGSVTPAVAVTDSDGRATFRWNAGNDTSAQLRMTLEGAAEVEPGAASAESPRVEGGDTADRPNVRGESRAGFDASPL